MTYQEAAKVCSVPVSAVTPASHEPARISSPPRKKSYPFQIDVGLRPDGKRDRPQFTYDTLKMARRDIRANTLRNYRDSLKYTKRDLGG
ncbi:hypothetical protein ACQPXH_08910 [Nocardia sp. CA-135953]|uniref:hypothetical protein n=1 Tax=Nocardia sp. CA-135953 TaxID=3239978 RepID=UPI003D95B761